MVPGFTPLRFCTPCRLWIGIRETRSLDLQIAAGTVTLPAMSASPASVQKGQSVNVAVNVLVNGVQAASNALTVAFTSSCGTVSPASTSTHMPASSTKLPSTKPPSKPSSPQGRINSAEMTMRA